MAEVLAVLRTDPVARRRRWLITATAMAALVALGVYEYRARRARLCLGAEEALSGVWDAPRKKLIKEAFTRTGLRSAPSLWAATEHALDEYAQKLVAMRTSACEATRVKGEQSEELLDLRMQCLDDRVRELRALTGVLASADGAVVGAADRSALALSAVADCADSEALRAGTRLPGDAKLRAQVLALKDKAALAKILYDVDKYAEAVALAGQVIDQAEIHPPVRGEALQIRGGSERYLNRVDDALRDDKEAAHIGLRHHQDTLVAKSWIEIGVLTANQKKLDDALEWNQLAASVIARMGSSSLELKRLQSLAYLYMSGGQLPKAEAAARQALSLAKLSDPGEGRPTAGSCDMLASVLFYQGRFADALPIYQRALAIYQRGGERELLGAASAGTNLGTTYAYLHRYQEAAAAIEKALKLREQIFEPDSIFIADSLTSLAVPLLRLGRFDDAAAALDRLAPIVDKNRDTLGDAVAQVVWIRGEIALGRGQVPEAVALLEKALSDASLPPIPRAHAQLALARANPSRARSLAAEAKQNALRDQPPDPLLADEAERLLK
jgi:tetratricopeptide (TPR) repeat protein